MMHPLRQKALLKQLLFCGLVLILLILRRPDQLLHPYIWDEDKNILLQWLNLGFGTFIEPMNNYLITVPKLINFISVHISFLYYPEVSTLFALIFDYAVILMVAYSPTIIGWRKLAALAVILIPINGEVYLLPLYTIWFAGLLLLLSLLWQFQAEPRKWFTLRIIFMCLGGLSSPLTVILTPAFWLRFLALKTKREFIIATLSSFFAGIQAWAVFVSYSTEQKGLQLSFNLLEYIRKFYVWMFFHFITNKSIYILWVLISFVLFAYLFHRLWQQSRAKQQSKWFLLSIVLFLYAIIAVILAATLRVDLAALESFTAGPRYFFYPYSLIAFLLCWIGFHSRNFGKIIAVLLLLLAFANVLGHYARKHDQLNWREYVRHCLQDERGFHFPIHFNGSAHNTWDMYLTKDECKKLNDATIW